MKKAKKLRLMNHPNRIATQWMNCCLLRITRNLNQMRSGNGLMHQRLGVS